MEARALHTFTATNNDELSFSSGDTVKILSEGDKVWMPAEIQGQQGLVPGNYIEFNPPSWYQAVSKDEAVKILSAKQPAVNGSFLVRPSETNPGDLSLSVKINSIQHFKFLRSADGCQYYLWNNAPAFFSINALVEHYKQNSVSNKENVRLVEGSPEKVIASYDFESRSPEELTIFRGDVITVSEKMDMQWWKGQVDRNGRLFRGLFPANYVSPYTN